MEEAIFLTRYADKVAVVHRRDKLRASKIMQDKAFANRKIHFVWDSVIDEVYDVGARTVRGVKLRNVKSQKVTDLKCDGVFVAIGHTPNTSIFRGQLEMDANGYIKTHLGARTNVPGVFAAGDVQDSVFRQAISAAGSGCMAAIEAERFLENHG